MTRIKAVKQKAILDVAESLGYSFRRLSGHIYEHPDMIPFGFLRIPILLNGFQEINKGM
ncbi:hypothetical protein C4K59_002391 [Streptococcus thermophilus]|uniref:DNA primase (Type) n=1 Tax=Streptococcus thermophilus TaxID=1308 RepID=A0A2X3U5H6_STRTR|nr:hypothetical protein C4K59_002391 [Streptococcus thermophilus]SQF24040.1 DNA primase (type) [Streptococcus thermophilus]